MRFNLGRLFKTLPTLSDDGVLITNNFKLADKTYRYATKYLTEPLQVAAGIDALDYVHDSLVSFGESDFAFPGATPLTVSPMTFELGDHYLDVYNTVLQAVGYEQLIVNEDGDWSTRVAVDFQSSTAEWSYVPGTTVAYPADVEPELVDVPNVIHFVPQQGGPTLPVEGNGIYTVTNQSTGPSSVDSRGATVEQTIAVEAQDQTSLETIGNAESQRIFAGGGYNVTLNVAWNPLHSDSDIIEIEKPRLNIPLSTWLVTSWEITLKDIETVDDIIMQIRAARRVALT
jgi:hypothetical protein